MNGKRLGSPSATTTAAIDEDDGDENVQVPREVVYLGRDILGDLNLSESREFLVTNGIGGYASLTLANSLTRSYHGMLIAALKPPLDRTLLLTKLNETVIYHNTVYHLGTDRRKENCVKKQSIVRRLSKNINAAAATNSRSTTSTSSSSSSTSSSGATTAKSSNTDRLNSLSISVPTAASHSPANPNHNTRFADSLDTTGFIYPIWKPVPSRATANASQVSSYLSSPASNYYFNNSIRDNTTAAAALHSSALLSPTTEKLNSNVVTSANSNNTAAAAAAAATIDAGRAGIDYPNQKRTAKDEVITPFGFELLQSFYLEGTVPVFVYNFSDAILEKRIWMKQNKNTVYTTYYLKKSLAAIQLRLKALVNHRNHHRRTPSSNPHFNYSSNVGVDGCSVSVLFTIPNHSNYTNLCMRVNRGVAILTNEWINGFVLSEERERGLPDVDDNLHVATFVINLPPGGKVTFMASAEPDSDDISMDGDAELSLRHRYEMNLLKQFRDARLNSLFQHLNNYENNKCSDRMDISPTGVMSNPLGSTSSSNQSESGNTVLSNRRLRNFRIEPVIKQLVLAADQFIITRSGGRSVVAGFHWFADWARDTMISLPGLTIATGRFDVARSILITFSKFVSKGMLPNRFPDDGSEPTEDDYDNADGTLWYFEAIRAYYAATNDLELLIELYPILQDIVEHHVKGTRFNIKQDVDGLLKAGQDGYALTWMDAKTNVVYTPRRGKPIELGALWFNALQCMTYFSDKLNKYEDSEMYSSMSDVTEQSFQEKYWNAEKEYCYDVIECDGKPNVHDDSLRPNQLIAISLNWSPVTIEQKYKILEVCERHLLTSHAIRTLSPFVGTNSGNNQYKGVYHGDVFNRDSSYHQGVGWTWLLGPFILSHLRVYRDKAQAREYLKPLLKSHLNDAGCGSVSELFDGDPPHRPAGCISQAWSVGEVLRAHVATELLPHDDEVTP